MYLIVGLGNPGSEYKNTRHNTGFQVISLWSRDLGVRLTNRRFQSRNTRTKLQAKEIILLCPSTYMNQSGKSVKACADYYDLRTEKILIVHDDLDLPVGKVKVVRNGSSGGHKGVLSIIEYLGSTKFPRIKIGIGRPLYGEKPEDYVLEPFYVAQREIMESVFKVAVSACQLFVLEGVESVMNHVNCQNLVNKEEKN